MHPKYPMLLDVRDRPIVIIGGGQVAARKAAGFARRAPRECGLLLRSFPGRLMKACSA
jgi:hypothetical protein